MRTLIGIDEAGRGPLAGPVAVGAVAVAENVDLLQVFPGLNDSKKLSEKKREQLFVLLEERVTLGDVRFAVEYSSAEVIDTSGVTFAVHDALARAVRALAPDPGSVRVVLDGSLKAPKEYEQETIVHGDSLVPAIMLASVAAKVMRDRLMATLALDYPGYGLEIHKGYGTKAHYEALGRLGPCKEHRQRFLSKWNGAT